MIDPKDFIEALKATDAYIQVIYSNGSCYSFHKLLKKLYPQAKPYLNFNKNHVYTEIDGRIFDINGEHPFEVMWTKLLVPNDKDIEKMQRWGFHKYNEIYVRECPNCEEPIPIPCKQE